MVAGNVTFPIYNSDGTSFNGLELKKSVYESVVMSLGNKISGDVYYPNNTLVVTMKEYITYNGVKYVLVKPPTIVREGMVSDNGELKGMTKYSFTFYHPMYMLGNFPFCDVAVSSDQQRYLSENKTFFWIGNLTDFVAKLNKNLEDTEWYCVINDSVSQADRQRLSDVIPFDKKTIADAVKTGYETWGVPYIISVIPSTNPLYQQGKRFIIQYGLPSTEILVENAQHELVPFVFHFGQGVGLKNNSRTPRNNKIITRIAGYGSENNIQYGYPQIPYEGGDCQYPLYYGIVGGQRVQLIKHPFTRTHLMPSIYRETVNKKVNPMATGYDPTIELKDYYDADNTYENPIKPLEPSYEIHEFEKIKPELGQRFIVGVSAYSDKDLDSISLSSFISLLSEYYTESEYLKEKEELEKIINTIGTMSSNSGSVNTRAYYCDWSFTKDERYAYVKFKSSALNFEYTVLVVSPSQDVEWDDTMDDDGNYVQSYFRITIPQLAFDLYASAAVTQEMTINMRSGACLGCSFPVMVDWDDYKLNFYDADGNFSPNGSQRNYDKYPDSSQGQITLILKKETSTFGTLMPNIYQKPHIGDEFVILGISLPTSYITSAEARLDAEMKQYMRDNNVYYYDYPLKFDEHFLTTHAGILAQMDNNVIVRFDYAGTEHALYIKQVTVKYENKPLPTYDITLTDNIEVVLNQIGQVIDEVRRLQDNLGGVEVQPSNNYLRKDIDDTAYGMIRLIKGLQVGNRFVTGLLGEGGVFRKEEDGTTYLECDKLYVRMKAYFDTVEVRHYMHSAGNRVASNAGINCSRVEYIDSNGDVTQDATEATLFRCYFRANDDGREVRNDFVIGDLAFCRETNVNTDSADQHGYWRAVVGRNVNGVLTDDGEGWIDLSASDCQDGSGIPIAQDDIVQLGNKTDTTRQGAIVEFVSGTDAPSYQIYQGINTYSLNGKNYIGLGYSTQTGRAYLNVFGDAFIGDPDGSTYIEYKQVGQGGVPEMNIKANVTFESPITHSDTTLVDFANSVVGGMESLQDQIDGSIETWFYDYMPVEEDEGAPANTTPLVTRTVSGQKVPVYPYYDWFIADGGDPTTTPVTQPTSTTERLKHLGDTFYDNTSGYAFRFSNTGTAQSPTFAWVVIQDSAVIKALADAAKAQDTADHKRRAFVLPITIGSTTYNYPYPPYDVGDLWLNAKYPYNYDGATDVENDKYNNDVLRCITPQGENGSFSIDHWVLASKYTDDTEVKRIIDSYGGILGVTADSEDVGEALGFLREVLGGRTSVDGGLILSELIAVKNGNQVMSGINGKIKASTGILTPAAWYGGEMVDYERLSDTEIADGWNVHHWARALFRFDGSGYVADGNLAWNGAGEITKIAGQDVEVETLLIGGNSAATQNWVSQNFVTVEFFERLFRAYFGNNTVSTNAPSSTQIDNIEARYSLWTNGDLSCLGHGSGGGGGSTTALSDLVDVLLTSPTSGQALVYNGTKWVNQTISGGGGVDMSAVWSALNAATSEQINASHLTNALSGYVQTSALTNYLPIAGGTLNGEVITSSPITINGYNGRTFGITPTSSGHQGDNVDVGWNWVDKDGAGAFFRSTDANSNPGSFGFYARNSAGTTKEFIGKPDGALTWGNDNILHTGNFATEVGASLFTALTSTNATNLTVTIGGTTKTLTNIYALRFKGVQVKEDAVSYGDLNSLTGTSYSVVTNYNTNNSWQHAPTIQTGNYWGGAVVVKGQDSNLMMQLFWNAKHNESTTPTGKLWFRARTSGGWGDDWKEIAFTDGNVATATALATARTLWGQSFDGTSNVSGSMTGVGAFTQSGAINMQGSTASYCQGIRLHPANGTSSIFFGCDADSGMSAGMFGITHNTTGLRVRGQASTTATSLVDYLTVAYGGNVGIGTSSPSYLLHVNGQAAAQSFRSTVETGVAPMVVASSTLVTNLNADLLDGKHSTDFAAASDMTTLQGYFDASGNARNALRLTTVSKTAWGQTYWTANGVPTNISGDMSSVGNIALTNGARIHHPDVSGNTLYIGNASNRGWVKIADMCSQDGDSYWKIKSNGDATFSNVYSNGVLTCLTGSSTSDARKKMIVGQVDLSVESIAKMPTVKFLWKHIPDKTVQVGTLAQSWQNVLPEAVTENDGVLGFQYGVAALLSAIVTARKVVDHEKRIAQLEKENVELRNELNKIKAA